MNWRRGLLLAVINLAVAIPVVLWADSLVAAHAAEMREREQHARTVTQPSSGQSVALSFDPCTTIDEYSAKENVLISANPIAITLTDWRAPCPGRWTLAGMLHADGWAYSPSAQRTQRKVDAGLLLLIALQWFLLGAFPIKGPRRWREPGMFITICSTLGIALAFIPLVENVAKLPALIALLAWLWWIAFALWRAIRSTYRWAARRFAHGVT